MNAHASRIWILLALLGLAVAGCDGDPPATPDGGPGEDASTDDGGEPGDAGDTTAPTVIATSPPDGATLVAVDTAIAVAFSEPMDTEAGSITATADTGPIPLGPSSWSADRETVTVTPTATLPAGATITVTIAGSHRDDAGNELAEPFTFELTTEDAVAPTIVRTAPVEGASAVDPGLATIELEVSEPMDVTAGRVRIEGPGTPVIGAITWTDRTAQVTVSDLQAEASYRVIFEGFVDPSGNALDRAALGAEGALDFTTGADTVAPRVVTSTPREGQLDVDVSLTRQVAIELSEPMDESAGTFTLEVGGVSTPLDPQWDRGGRRVLLSVADDLAAAAPHRIVVSSLRDLAGNALDGTAYLIDGALDFTTGTDLFVPFVAFTSPEEGASDVPGGLLRLVVVFSEAMDPATITAPMTGDGRAVTLSGAWSSGNTVLTLEAPMLQAGRSYQLDLRGFRDAGGTLVDATHAYLGDGIASFSLAAPTGESCGDALTETEAVVTAGRHVWTIASGSVTRGDGSAPCDLDGHGPDALVRFRKTTPAARDGGSVLHVQVTPTTAADRLDVDILANECRAGESLADASRLRCLVEREGWEQWLDVGPGDYFVWVARDGSAAFTGATVVIEELPAPRAGESCGAPLGVTAPTTIYTAPTMPGQPHRWVLPAGYSDALDRGRTHTDPTGAVSCMPAGSARGHDAVVQYDKASSTSLVTMRVEMPSVSARHGAVEIVRGCDPTDATRTEIACLPYSSSAIDREITLDGPAGPISTWVVERRSAAFPSGVWADSPEATIEIVEFEPGPGDSCATAIPIVPGTNAVTASRPWRAHVPACMATGGVTWFRYTPTQGLGVLRTNIPTTGAVVERASSRTLRCQGDDTGTGLPVFGVPGQEVCVGLSSNAGVTQITLEEIPYSGVRGIETELVVEVPSGVSSPSTLSWMAVLQDRVYRSGPGRIQVVSTSGGPLAQQSYTGLTSDGGGAVARPEGLYVLSSSSSATSGPRLLRVTDAAGAFLTAPVPLEVLPSGFSYPDRAFDALTWDGTQFIAATGQATSANTNPTCCTPVHFYAIPADGSAPVALGSNDIIDDVSGIAADATYLYVVGRISTGTIVDMVSHYDEAIFRLRRDQLADPAQMPVVLVNGFDLSNDNGALYVDDTSDADVLYVQLSGSSSAGHGSDVLVVVDPDGDAPRWVGPLWRAPTRTASPGLAYDGSIPVLWLLDTSTTPDRWIRLD